jgi:hypothetical protein
LWQWLLLTGVGVSFPSALARPAKSANGALLTGVAVGFMAKVLLVGDGVVFRVVDCIVC